MGVLLTMQVQRVGQLYESLNADFAFLRRAECFRLEACGEVRRKGWKEKGMEKGREDRTGEELADGIQDGR